MTNGKSACSKDPTGLSRTPASNNSENVAEKLNPKLGFGFGFFSLPFFPFFLTHLYRILPILSNHELVPTTKKLSLARSHGLEAPIPSNFPSIVVRGFGILRPI